MPSILRASLPRILALAALGLHLFGSAAPARADEGRDARVLRDIYAGFVHAFDRGDAEAILRHVARGFSITPSRTAAWSVGRSTSPTCARPWAA